MDKKEFKNTQPKTHGNLDFGGDLSKSTKELL
jgi:hypothetical protein